MIDQFIISDSVFVSGAPVAPGTELTPQSLVDGKTFFWGKDENGNTILNEDGDPVLMMMFNPADIEFWTKPIER